MAWSLDNATQLTTISSTEQFFDKTPQVSPGETYHLQVKINFKVGAVDNGIVSLFTTAAASAINFDDIAFMQFEVALEDDADQVISFLVRGVRRFRVGVKSAGTDDLDTADLALGNDGISL